MREDSLALIICAAAYLAAVAFAIWTITDGTTAGEIARMARY